MGLLSSLSLAQDMHMCMYVSCHETSIMEIIVMDHHFLLLVHVLPACGAQVYAWE